MILELIIAVIIGGVAGYTGSLMLSKRLSLIGGPLGHLTMPGVVIALILGFDVTLGALIILLISALIIWLIQLRTKLPLESVTAIVFAVTLGVAFLFLPDEELSIALIGGGSVSGLFVSVLLIAGSVIIYLINKLRRGLILISLNEDLAVAQGVNVKLYNLSFMILITIVVSLSVRVVGGLMTAALVSIPASASHNLTKSLSNYMRLSLIIGALSGGLGVWLAGFFSLPPGPLIVISSGLFFSLSLIRVNG